MNLEQILRAKPINTACNKEFEEKRITKQDKDGLDKVIDMESKRGWLVKARSHDSEGNHGVVLYKKVSV